MEDFVEVQEVADPSNGLQVYQQDKALIDIQIATAKRYPRNITSVLNKCVAYVTLTPKIAESCIFTIQKGAKITGPSVHLARIIAKQMGNMRIDCRVIGYDETHVTAEATCFDLENNFALRTQTRRSILDKDGIRFSADLTTITGNAAMAIALRNSIFTVVGKEIVDEVLQSAKNKITGNITTEQALISRRQALIEGLKKSYAAQNLTEEEIVKAAGKDSVNHIGQDEILVLIGYERAIKEGELDFETVFRPIDKKIVKPASKKEKADGRLVVLLNDCKTRADLKRYEKDLNSIETRTLYDELWEKLK